ncbi:hypothetical protein ACFPRL_25345 [Pseudoclavibacter helvolus]
MQHHRALSTRRERGKPVEGDSEADEVKARLGQRHRPRRGCEVADRSSQAAASSQLECALE